MSCLDAVLLYLLLLLARISACDVLKCLMTHAFVYYLIECDVFLLVFFCLAVLIRVYFLATSVYFPCTRI